MSEQFPDHLAPVIPINRNERQTPELASEARVAVIKEAAHYALIAEFHQAKADEATRCRREALAKLGMGRVEGGDGGAA